MSCALSSKATEQNRSSVEARLKEAQEYHKQLEQKLMEAEKEKQGLEEEKRKAVEGIEKQVAQPEASVLLETSNQIEKCSVWPSE